MTLLKRLQDKRDWLAQTNGLKHASAQLTRDDLDQIIDALERNQPVVGSTAGPMKKLHQMSNEEISALLDDRYGKKSSTRKRLNNCA